MKLEKPDFFLSSMTTVILIILLVQQGIPRDGAYIFFLSVYLVVLALWITIFGSYIYKETIEQ